MLQESGVPCEGRSISPAREFSLADSLAPPMARAIGDHAETVKFCVSGTPVFYI
jgi:hypothetical protein